MFVTAIFRRILTLILSSASVFALFTVAVPPATASDVAMERAEMKAILDQVSNKVQKEYYDPTMHGLNWPELVSKARQKIDAADDPGAMLAAIYGVLEKLNDSHTIFLPPRRTRYAKFGFEAKVYGDEARISKVKKKSPAEKAGLEPGDRILKLNGYEPTRASLDPLLLYYHVLLPVAEFQLVVQRGDEPPRTVRIPGEIHDSPAYQEAWRTELINDAIREEETDAKENPFKYSMQDGVGYIALPHFESSVDLLKDLLKKVEHSKAIIVDLRGNPGGSLQTTATFAGMFERQPTVLGDFVGRKKTEPIKVKPMSPNLTVPMYILVDSESGSAAEIFARQFQREGRAVVIGDQSSGSVMVAEMFPGHIGTELSAILFGMEITVGRMVLPGGEELEHKGVTPDRRCIPTPQDLRSETDVCRALAFQLATQSAGTSASAAGGGH